MIIKKECVAMLLAGGQGSRLYALTNKIAKPAVCYGGKYRIIDFPLSNCVNSGIDTVGVLTQYQPLLLNEYIGNGQPWDLDRAFGGVRILPPYQGKKKTDWYKGTANAIYQNLNFINRYDPEYVLILSGDHIYKMDYQKMLEQHKKTNADCTIAVIQVPLAEASRFGILNTKDNDEIYEFEEKPAKPKSTNASMGIYIFNTGVLEKYLIEDEEDPNSVNDFGKNIIPKMLNDGLKMYAYRFEGYWKDVGTIASLHESNMDLLGENPKFNLNSPSWKIMSRNDEYPPQFISSTSHIENSMIVSGCVIEGTVINSVLSNNVHVKKGAVVKDSVIFHNVVIDENSTVNYSIIDEDAVIGKNASVGEEKTKTDKITVIASKVKVNDGSRVEAGKILEEDK